jgi:hypothetical protein
LEILLNDLPNNLYVDAEIIVNDTIPQTDDFTPLDFGMLGLEILRQAIGGFADDFQITDDRVDGFIVFYEIVVIQPDYVTFDLLNLPKYPRSEAASPTGHRPIPL